MENLLPADLFVRIHNSWMVGIAHIDRIENNHVHCAEAVIPIGEKYREEFYRRIGTSDK
jgi:DNA-binding LytR/AlgR family response regulator